MNFQYKSKYDRHLQNKGHKLQTKMVSIFTEEGESRESELPSNNELVGEDGLQKQVRQFN